MRSPRSLLLVAVLCITASHLAASDLQINLQAGFGGFCRLGAIIPVRVELRNQGPTEIRGGLEVSQPGSDFLEFPEHIFAESVRIPPGGRVLIETTLRPLTDSYPVAARFLPAGSTEALQVENELRATSAGVVLALSRRRAFDFLQRELPGTAVAYPHYERLPAAWTAYEAVRLLILDDQPLPDSHALEAVADWVYTGGELWLNTGESRLSDSPLMSVLGLDSAGIPESPWRPIPVGAGRILLYPTSPAEWTAGEREDAGRLARRASATLLTTAREALIRPFPGTLHPALGRLERDLPLLQIPGTALIALLATTGIALFIRRSGLRLALLLTGGLLLAGLYSLYLSPFLDRGTKTELRQLVSRGGEAAVRVRYRAFLRRTPLEDAPHIPIDQAEIFELFDSGLTGRDAKRNILIPTQNGPWRPFLHADVEPGSTTLGLHEGSAGVILYNSSDKTAEQILLIDETGVYGLPDLPSKQSIPLDEKATVELPRQSIPREARQLADLSRRSRGARSFISAVLEESDTRLLVEVSR